MHADGFEQLSAIAGLSQQKDGLSLTRALIGTLGSLVPGVSISVFEVFARRSLEDLGQDGREPGIVIRRFDDSGRRGERLVQLDGMLRALQTFLPVEFEHEGGRSRLVLPLRGDAGPARLVTLDGLPEDPWIRTRVIQVVEIYGNLVRMMDSRERDALTSLLNRQTFATLFGLAAGRLTSGGSGLLYLAVLDIDHFKRINDTFGHLYGDEVLIHFSRLMERSFRHTDDLFRFGGEEFVVLLTSDRAQGARSALERFRHLVEDYAFPGVGRVTVSIGFVRCQPGMLPTSLVDMADRALYAAKEAGRNRSMDFSELPEDTRAEGGEIQLF
jgi:diguanylate cyclase